MFHENKKDLTINPFSIHNCIVSSRNAEVLEGASKNDESDGESENLSTWILTLKYGPQFVPTVLSKQVEVQ